MSPSMAGRELGYRPGASFFGRLYYRLLGNPNLGEHIRNLYFSRAIAGLDLNGKRILDAGCGWGPYSYYLSKRFPSAQIDSCDLFPSTVAKNQITANRLGLKNIHFFQRDLAHLDKTDSYDLILCIDVLEHIPEDEAVLVRFYDALKDGGLLYLHVPATNFRSLLSPRYAEAIKHFEEHVREGYTVEGLKEKVARAGLRVLEAEATWRWWAELLWEICGLGTSSKAARALTTPLLRPLLSLDPLLPSQHGNGVSVLAEKGEGPRRGVKLSACVITKNEEGRLDHCLEALRGHVDEIVVVDSYSQDATVALAKRFTERVYQREFTDFADQRNYATSLASHDWVLHLDADETLEDSFWPQVDAFLSQSERYRGYAAICFPRKTFDEAGNWVTFGKPRNYPGFLDRLYDRRRAHWVGTVHERLAVQGRRKFLPAHILHHSFDTRHFIEKTTLYRTLAQKGPSGYAVSNAWEAQGWSSKIGQAYFYARAMMVDLGFWRKGPRYWLFLLQWFAYRLGLRLGKG